MIAEMGVEIDEQVPDLERDDHGPDQGIVDEVVVQVVPEVQAEVGVPLEEAEAAVLLEEEVETEIGPAINWPLMVDLQPEGRLLVVAHQKSVVPLVVVVVLNPVLLPVPVAVVIPLLPPPPLIHLGLAHEEKRSETVDFASCQLTYTSYACLLFRSFLYKVPTSKKKAKKKKLRVKSFLYVNCARRHNFERDSWSTMITTRGSLCIVEEKERIHTHTPKIFESNIILLQFEYACNC